MRSRGTDRDELFPSSVIRTVGGKRPHNAPEYNSMESVSYLTPDTKLTTADLNTCCVVLALPDLFERRFGGQLLSCVTCDDGEQLTVERC